MASASIATGVSVLLTGATGFVGRNLRPALVEHGHRVRCMTRAPEQARQRDSSAEWVSADVSKPETLRPAMEGCVVAFYLVHSMGESQAGFRERELLAAHTFAEAAADAGLQRIVYLGGVAPEVSPSEHLRSRLAVGRTLREGRVPAIELRASMIVGYGSLSWLIVRDLAARLPFMVLPRWLNSLTQPVGIGDVVAALVGALDVPLDGGQWYDIPGPEALSGKEILVRTARQIGLACPVMVTVPVLSPWLSSHWVHFVTRAQWEIAREIVVGLSDNLLAQDDGYWQQIGHVQRQLFDQAAHQALAEEARHAPVGGAWGAVERMLKRIRAAGR